MLQKSRGVQDDAYLSPNRGAYEPQSDFHAPEHAGSSPPHYLLPQQKSASQEHEALLLQRTVIEEAPAETKNTDPPLQLKQLEMNEDSPLSFITNM